MIIHGGHCCVLLLTADDAPFSRRQTVSYDDATIGKIRSVSKLKLLKKRITNKKKKRIEIKVFNLLEK